MKYMKLYIGCDVSLLKIFFPKAHFQWACSLTFSADGRRQVESDHVLGDQDVNDLHRLVHYSRINNAERFRSAGKR